MPATNPMLFGVIALSLSLVILILLYRLLMRLLLRSPREFLPAAQSSIDAK